MSHTSPGMGPEFLLMVSRLVSKQSKQMSQVELNVQSLFFTLKTLNEVFHMALGEREE